MKSEGWSYPGLPIREYKDTPGSHQGVTRREMFVGAETAFDTRYFEVASEGYTSFEVHCHEHCVVVLRGEGRVRLGDEWRRVSVGDTVYVAPNMPHQFANDGSEPFGILCVVDRVRDRPTLVQDATAIETLKT